MYLATYGPVYPAQDVDGEKMCGDCGERPAVWGDWLCKICRRRLERMQQENRDHA